MGTDRGHQIKTRALENHILYNRIEDVRGGNSSRHPTAVWASETTRKTPGAPLAVSWSMRNGLLLATSLTLALGCASAPADGGDSVVVPAGKADDFLSLSATEFVVSGRAVVTLVDLVRI